MPAPHSDKDRPVIIDIGEPAAPDTDDVFEKPRQTEKNNERSRRAGEFRVHYESRGCGSCAGCLGLGVFQALLLFPLCIAAWPILVYVYDYRWWTALPLAIALYILSSAFVFLLIKWMTGKKRRHS